jgi:KaiC/GvpD/RAD55 family RecA-like ATPase
LHILGTIGVFVWLRAQEGVRGTLRVAISEATANASVVEIRSASVTVGLPSLPYQVIFGLGTVDWTAEAGSTVRFEAQFTPTRQIPVMMLWDDPSAPTRLTLQVESIPRVTIRVHDESGRVSTIFPENESGIVRLISQVSVEDAFHGTNVKTVSLSLVNASGFFLIRDTPMNLTSRTDVPFRLDYALPIEIRAGSYDVTVSVVDAANRIFLTTERIIITSFHTLILRMIDPQSRPIPDLNISIFAIGQLVGEVTTNSSGMATIQVPSSAAVGALSLLVRRMAILIYSQVIDVALDTTLTLVLPLYDWAIAVRLRILDLPVSGAKVDLYLNGTLVATALSDSNGVARFASIALGEYEVSVISILGSTRFFNVTHSRELGATALEVEDAMLILGAVTVATVFGVYAVARRRVARRRFRNVAELLGGTIPRAIVMMIVGPSGSGKSVLLQNILADSLRDGRSCVYVSNAELPSRIRDQLAKMGFDAQACERERKLRFVDAYSGTTEAASPERHSVPSPTDLTSLGIQLTSCIEELGGVADVFLDSLTPIAMSASPERSLDFLRYYGARTTKSGGSFLYVATTTIGPESLGRFEEASDCVLQTEGSVSTRRIRGRLLVKKARGIEHEHDWLGFKITQKGRMEFLSLPGSER